MLQIKLIYLWEMTSPVFRSVQASPQGASDHMHGAGGGGGGGGVGGDI